MPPKTKVTREDIIAAAVELVRKSGEDGLNARDIASSLGCSTQPIFTNFASMSLLHEAVIERGLQIFDLCLEKERAKENCPPYKAMGLGYIRFAAEETELFKLIFMRDRTKDGGRDDTTESTKKSVEMIMKSMGMSMEKAFMFHLEMWIFVHGIASMVASSYLNWEQNLVGRMLTDAFEGIKSRFTSEEE